MKKPKINQRFKYQNKNRVFYATIKEIDKRLLGYKIDGKHYAKDNLDWIIWKHEVCHGSVSRVKTEYNKYILMEE
jgi:hypothetical protein